MKKQVSRLLAFALAVAMLTCTTFAAEQSSLYLSAYRAWLTPTAGAKVDVNIHVQAVDYMDDIGATMVEIYESSDGGVSFSNVRTYVCSLHEGMLLENDYLYYETPITHQGTSGYKYYAIVTVYAGDSTGSDSREYQTTTVTARS